MFIYLTPLVHRADMNDGKAIEPGPGPGRFPSGEGRPVTNRLQDYMKLKHAIARTIRSIRSPASAVKNNRVATEGQDLMYKLGEDRFTLAMWHVFKHEKSSPMNAVIGRYILLTGMLPLISAITILKYRSAEKLMILRERNIDLPKEPAVSALAEYVTERGNFCNQKDVKAALLNYHSSQGVCLRYLVQAIRIARNSGLIRQLLQHASRRFMEAALIASKTRRIIVQVREG